VRRALHPFQWSDGAMRVVGRIAIVVLSVALAVPAPAGAHALLVSSDPADGSRIDSSPQRVRLAFSEEISPRFHSVQLVGPGGRRIAGTRLDEAGSTITLDVPKLAKGTYAVDWRVVAEDDGHTTSGTVVFGVGVAAAMHAASVREVTPSPVEAALRWLRFSALALVVGGLALACVLPTGSAAESAATAARRRVLTAAALGSGLAAIALLASLARQISGLSSSVAVGFPVVLDLLFSSRWGALWWLEESSLLILLIVAMTVLRRGRMTWADAALAVIWTALVAVCEALSSHSASVSGVAVAVDASHLLSAGLWLGSVAALAVAIWPRGAVGRADARLLVAAGRWRFASIAAAGATGAALTGLYSAGREVASVDALLTTFYGRALLAKTAAVALAVTLGAANAICLTRAARGRGAVLGPLIAVEAIVGIGAFLGAGILTASSPARGAQFGVPRPVRAPTLVANVDDVLVSATVRPNRPGENVLSVQAVSSRRPPPAPIASIGARLAGAGRAIQLQRIDVGRYFATVALSRPGPAGMSLAVHRAGRTLPVRFRWSVEQPDPARSIVVSNRRLSSIVDPLALALGAALAAVAAFALLLRHARVSVSRLQAYREEPS
jgi:copper transport protein